MGNKKKMKLPFLSSQSKSLDPKIYSSSSSSTSQPWPFPSCGNIRTLSFKAKDDGDAFRTFNSAFLEAESSTPPDSYFSTVSSSSRSFSTMSDEDSGDTLESVIRGLRSERLFFDPEQSSSLLLCDKPIKQEADQHETKHEHELEHEKGSGSIKFGNGDGDNKEELAYKESEILSMESNSPYEDFKKSMEEMVEAHELKDWQGLEELLGCYLKINGKNNHAYIVGAFIDLLVSLSFTNFESTSTTTTTTSTTNITPNTTITTTTSSSYSNYSSPSSPLSLPSSSLTTPCLSSILDHGDDDEHDDDDGGKHHDDDDDNHVTC